MPREIDEHFAVLCADPPPFLAEYALAPELQRLGGVGLFCGTDYSKIYSHRYFYSRLDHSWAAALIVWRFTGSKVQSIAALLHDIATPVFSHSVDFMQGDSATQTSTEALTHDIIASSAHITGLLARDAIPVSAVDDYHRYPIADNDTPRLSADRLEYTLSTMLVMQNAWTIGDIQAMFAHIEVLENEDGEQELGFGDIGMAERFVQGACGNALLFQRNENKLSLNLLGDLLKTAMREGLLAPRELYTLTEPQLIGLIERAEGTATQAIWRAYTGLTRVYGRDTRPEGRYAVQVQAKQRYIDPLVRTPAGARRLTDVSDQARQLMASTLAYADKPCAFVDFDLPVG